MLDIERPKLSLSSKDLVEAVREESVICGTNTRACVHFTRQKGAVKFKRETDTSAGASA